MSGSATRTAGPTRRKPTSTTSTMRPTPPTRRGWMRRRCRSSTGTAPNCGVGSSRDPTPSSRAGSRSRTRLTGWRIDVANMTGRLGAEDLNAVVRQTVRRTMIEVSSDTLLLAESTNDAASDLQGDAWHGGMTYPAFTRGVWSWLAEPRRIPHRGFDGRVSDEMWFFGLPTGMPRYTAQQFVRQLRLFTSQIPVACAARDDVGPRHPRHRPVRHLRRGGDDPARRRSVDDAARHPRRLRRRRVRTRGRGR